MNHQDLPSYLTKSKSIPRRTLDIIKGVAVVVFFFVATLGISITLQTQYNISAPEPRAAETPAASTPIKSPATGSSLQIANETTFNLGCTSTSTGPYFRYVFAQSGKDLFYIHDDCQLTLNVGKPGDTNNEPCQIALFSPGPLEVRVQKYSDKQRTQPVGDESKNNYTLTGTKYTATVTCDPIAAQPTVPVVTVIAGGPTLPVILPPATTLTPPVTTITRSLTPTIPSTIPSTITTTPAPTRPPTTGSSSGSGSCNPAKCGICGWTAADGMCRWDGAMPDGSLCCYRQCQNQRCAVLSGRPPVVPTTPPSSSSAPNTSVPAASLTCTSDVDCGAPAAVPVAAKPQLKCDATCGACGVSDMSNRCVSPSDPSVASSGLNCCANKALTGVTRLPTTSGADTILYILAGISITATGMYGIIKTRRAN